MAQTYTRHPPSSFITPPPLPLASYGVRRSRHYARGITVSQPPRQHHGLAILATPPATSLTGPWPLTSSVPPVTRHGSWPASSALFARSAQESRNIKPSTQNHLPTVRRHYEEKLGFVLIYAAWLSLRMRHFDVLRGTKELGGNSREAARRELKRLRYPSQAEGYVSMGTQNLFCKPLAFPSVSRPLPPLFPVPSLFSFPSLLPLSLPLYLETLSALVILLQVQ